MIHFYLYQKENLIVVSDLAKDKIIAKYGRSFEIVNSVREKEHLELIKQRVARSYPRATFEELLYVRKVFSEEYREKLRKAKLGKKRSKADKLKISLARKGKGNFEGKRHSEISKRMTSEAMKKNKNVKGKIWAYNPRTDEEIRVDNIMKVPVGYRLGRDPEKINENLRACNF